MWESERVARAEVRIRPPWVLGRVVRVEGEGGWRV